jgi:hypothetical protein
MVAFDPGWKSGPGMAEPQTIPVGEITSKVTNAVKMNFFTIVFRKIKHNYLPYADTLQDTENGTCSYTMQHI